MSGALEISASEPSGAPNIIGVVGLAGAGKDTSSDHLVANYGYEKIAFADRLKEIIGLVFDAPRELFYDPKLKEVSTILISQDRLAQRFEKQDSLSAFLTPILADLYNIHEDEVRASKINVVASSFFVDLTPAHESTPRHIMQQIGTEGFRHLKSSTWTDYLLRKLQSDPGRKYIVSDIRFPNEAQLVQSVGGKIFSVQRESVFELDHSSETQIKLINKIADVVLSNNNDIASLYRQIDSIMMPNNTTQPTRKTTRTP